MSPRNDDTPRRGEQPRRGTSRDLPAEGDETLDNGRDGGRDNGRGRGFGIGDARAYTPRGRTLAERDQRTRSPRAGRTTDPFRPALQVLDGGRPQRGRRPAESEPPAGTKPPAEDAKRGRREQSDPRRETPRSRRPAPGEDDGDELKQRRERTGRGVRIRDGARSGAAAKAPRDARSPFSSRTRKASATKTPGRTTAKGVPAGKSRAVRAIAPEPPKLANSTKRLRLGTVMALSLFVMIGV